MIPRKPAQLTKISFEKLFHLIRNYKNKIYDSLGEWEHEDHCLKQIKSEV